MAAEQSDQEKLKKEIIAKSESKTWEDAKREWVLETIFDKESHCLCKHFIVENCVIRNEKNHLTTIVGNVCVNHFKEPRLNVPAVARTSLKNLSVGGQVNPNEALRNVAVRLGILSVSESNWLDRWTKGNGSRTRFDPTHDNYQKGMDDTRKKYVGLILKGFDSGRPLCETCERYKKPRQNGTDKTFFYSCATPDCSENYINKK